MAGVLAKARDRLAPRSVCKTCHDWQALVVSAGEYAATKRCPDCAASCEACDGSGWVLYNDDLGQLLSKVCGCRSLDNRIRLFGKAALPLRYRHSTLENFEVAHAPELSATLARAREFVRDWAPGRRGLGLIGEPGCGKTHLLTAIVRELTLRRGAQARFIEFSHLLTEIKRGFDDGQSDAGLMLELGSVDLLVIDELGKELSTVWQTTVLDELISRRYNKGLTTCFTSNYPLVVAETRTRPADPLRVVSLEARVGGRVFSRLAELTHMQVVHAPDFRRRTMEGMAR